MAQTFPENLKDGRYRLTLMFGGHRLDSAALGTNEMIEFECSDEDLETYIANNAKDLAQRVINLVNSHKDE